MILTSNRTRELHDALKRRALFHWIGHPSIEREIEIVRLRVPGIPERLAAEAAAFVRELRGLDLAKPPGVAETIDWAMALNALGRRELDAEVVRADARLGAEVPRGHRRGAGRDPLAARRRGARRLRGAGSAPMAAGDAIVGHVVTFGRVLREAGLEVGPGRVADALRALDAVDLARQEDVYFSLRQTLVSRHDELDLFDRAFSAWFLRAPVLPPVRTRDAADTVTRVGEAPATASARATTRTTTGPAIRSSSARRGTSSCARRTSPS